MIMTLLKKEIHTQIVTVKGIIVLLTVIMLSVVSAIVMLEDFNLRVQNYELLETNSTGSIMRVPQPMSILTSSLDDQVSGKINIRDFGDIVTGSTQKEVNKVFDLFQTLDMHFIVLVVMSLTSVLFTFDSISGEKECQTLRVMLSNPVGRDKILFSKWLGSVVVITLPLAICFLLTMLIVAISQPSILDSDMLLRTGLLFLLSFTFCCVFAGTGLLISALNARSSISLIISILVWSFLVFILPPAVTNLSASLVGGKTETQYMVEKTNMWAGEFFKLSNRPELEWGTEAYDRAFLELSYKYGSGFKEYLNQEERRIELSRSLNLLSPTGVFHYAAWDIGGSGPEDILNYKKQVVNYQPIACKEIYERRQRQRRGEEKSSSGVLMKEVRRPLEEVILNNVLPSIGIHLMEVILLFGASYFVFTRYDVR